VKLGKQKDPKSVKGTDMPNNMAGRLPIVQTDIYQHTLMPLLWCCLGLLNLALTAVVAETIVHIS